jgi:hypothetical protein
VFGIGTTSDFYAGGTGVYGSKSSIRWKSSNVCFGTLVLKQAYTVCLSMDAGTDFFGVANSCQPAAT